MKKSSAQTNKQLDQKINNSLRKNYIQKKYEIAMKKNANDSLIDFEEEEKLPLATPLKQSSSKFIEFEQEGTHNQVLRHRKYLIKTSNKRPINSGTQYQSLNPVNERR